MELTAPVAVIFFGLLGCISVQAASLASSDSPWAMHHNYEEMLDVLKSINRKCPEITYLYNLTGHPDHTIQGRKLAVIVISDHPEEHKAGQL